MGNDYKVSVTEFTFSVIGLDWHYDDEPPSVASPPSCLTAPPSPRLRGKGGGASHQRGNAFPTPAGRLYGFSRQRRYKKWRRRRRTSLAQRYFIPPEGGALNLSGRRQPVPDRTLGAQGQRPGGAINPRGEAASTFGNTGKHRPADWYLSRDDSLPAYTEILRFTQDDEWEAGLPSH